MSRSFRILQNVWDQLVVRVCVSSSGFGGVSAYYGKIFLAVIRVWQLEQKRTHPKKMAQASAVASIVCARLQRCVSRRARCSVVPNLMMSSPHRRAA